MPGEKRTLLKHARIKQNGLDAQSTFPSGHNPINCLGFKRRAGKPMVCAFSRSPAPTLGHFSRSANLWQVSGRFGRKFGTANQLKIDA
jgi:hypothetical protein